MKYFGLILIAMGLAFLIFALYSFISRPDKLHSPVPTNNGVKVILITPEK